MKQDNLMPRVGIIDDLRGIGIIGVVLFHGFFDLVNFFSVNLPWFESALAQNFVQPMLAGSLIFISGISCRFSKNNLKRGALAFSLGLAIWVITAVVMPGAAVRFGVLSLLGSGMLFYGAVVHFFPKAFGFSKESQCPALLGVLFFIFFAFCYQVPQGTLGIFTYPLFRLPLVLYQSSYTFLLGFPDKYFWSSDYFPLIPWIFLYFSGVYFATYFVDGKIPKFCYRSYCKALNWAGRHSLVIYLLHQPLLMLTLTIVFRSVK